MQNLQTQRITVIVGSLLILAGVFLNEWLIAAFFSSDGIIADSRIIVIRVVDFCLISCGVIVIKCRGLLSKKTLFVITGILFIIAAIIFIEKFLPILSDNSMSFQNKLFLKVFEFYIVVSGLLLILYRRTIDFKGIILFGISSLFCFTIFLGCDYYRFYSKINKYRSAVSDYKADNPIVRLTEKDDKLGWKLIANRTERDTWIKALDVTYKIDKNGFKQVNNSEEKPDFSIYFFGDSFTFGEGVKNEDTFANIIKDKYLIKEINVYNAGVSGYGIVQMFQRFLNIKDRLQPGDVVIFTPLANDIERNLKDFIFPYFTKFTNTMKVDNFPFFANGVIKYRKMGNSFFYKLKLAAIGSEYTGYFFKSIRKKFIPDTTKESQEMIKIIEKETKLKGGKFVLFFLPQTRECLNGQYDVDISGFNYFDIRHFFPPEEEILNNLRLSKSDGHYNRRGHEIIAKAIVETLVHERIINKQYVSRN